MRVERGLGEDEMSDLGSDWVQRKAEKGKSDLE